MARTLRRPMFRIGGMAHEQRTGYMGGGMNGVMSGIMPTQPDAGLNPRMGLAGGGNIGGGIISGMSMGNRTGFQTPRIVGQGPNLQGSSYGKGFNITRLPATTPGVPANVANAGQKIVNAATRTGASTMGTAGVSGQVPAVNAGLMERLGRRFRNLIGNKGIISAAKNLAKGTVNTAFKYGTPAVQAAAGTLAIPAATIAGFSYMNYPVYPKGHPQEGEFMSKEEAAEVLSETGAATNMATGKGVQAGSAGDLSGEAAMFDLETGDYGNKPYATKLDFERPEVVKNSNEALGLNQTETEPKKKIVKKQEDPEKSLMDIYGENKGIIDKVLGDSDEETKKSMYLQLAKFGAGLAAQPGGDLVGAIGRAAEKPIEGLETTLAEKRKTDRETKLMALSKTFEDMKQPEQVKLIKQIQKEFGFDTFKEAYDYINKPKVNAAQQRANDEFYRNTAKEMGVSTEGFRRSMEELDELDLGNYIGNFTRPDALLPDDIDDRTPGEYYITPKGKPVRFVDGKLYGPTEPQFTKKLETKET